MIKLRNINTLNPNEIVCRENQILQEKWMRFLNTSWSLRSFHHQTVTKLLSSILNSLKLLKRWIHMNWDLVKHGKHIFDDFYCKKLDIEDIRRYNKLLLVVQMILTLSHGQAAAERGFSFGKSSLEVNIKKESIVAKKVVRERLSPSKQSRFAIFRKTQQVNNCM